MASDPVQATASASASASGPGQAAKPIRRRNRMINSCLECRKRKLKCSKTTPICTNCDKVGRECLYVGSRLAELKEKQGLLERQLELDAAKSAAPASQAPPPTLADEVEYDYDDQSFLASSTLTAPDLTYDDGVEEADEMIDLGIQVGKMRITERIGGLSRPRLHEEISAGLAGKRPPGPPPGQGPGSAYASSSPSSSDSIPEFMKPGPQYLAPTSGFFFGQIGDLPSVAHFLPEKSVADRLLGQYFLAVHPVATCVHRPSLERTYGYFWDDVNAGYEPKSSTQAVVFAALFSGAVSLDEEALPVEFANYSKSSWVASLKMGAETALSKANFLRTTKVETMQAFIMYMLPLCRAEVSRAHSVLVGTAVRMAECMGLHRDGETYGLNPLETQVRRLIWHQLCFLDIRTCEAQGPRPAIRREDYDTKLPVNCNDDELTSRPVMPEPANCWTTTTLALIRFEANEMMRSIWLDRRKLESRTMSLTDVLTKIENFRRKMLDKYDHLLDPAQPLQRYARCVMHLLIFRLHVTILHPYHSNAAIPMPPKLNHVLITSGIMILELAIQLEANQIFRDWSWYLGAYLQYQIALLLATEVYYRPDSPEADRIWPCLDFVFGLDGSAPREAKGLQILSEIQSKTAIYMAMRKVHSPTVLSQAVPSQNAVGGAARPPPGPSSNQAGTQQGTHTTSEPAKPELGQKVDMRAVPPTPRGPPPQMVFAGVANGQALWSLPPNTQAQPISIGGPSEPPPAGNIMDGIDWDAVNGLFQNDPQTGVLSIHGFSDPTLGLGNWNP